ncbi:protein TolR [Mangrovitalea sediminis]|uniref:protein TolR n=1 Tax=Mangrovitalea sediminis TaxID=1982043 RepID=UPI001D0D753D|nr:protein TolR [Mangrovitalea sediminis]
MAMTPHQRRKPMSDINVVPYIDVMLVLLVIFMITAPMLNQGVKVDLPKTVSKPITLQKNAEPLIVSVDANGAYFLNVGGKGSKPMPLSELTDKVAKILKAKPQTDVLVRGDSHVEYGTVVSLMAALRQAGAPSVGLITEKPRS